jgi:tetratricopeptide (TPR) repeat protein
LRSVYILFGNSQASVKACYVQYKPEDNSLQLQLAEFREIQGRIDEAIDIYRQVLDQSSTDERQKATASNNLAFALALRNAPGDLAEAEKMLELQKDLDKGKFPDEGSEDQGTFDPPLDRFRWEFAVKKVEIQVAETPSDAEGAAPGAPPAPGAGPRPPRKVCSPCPRRSLHRARTDEPRHAPSGYWRAHRATGVPRRLRAARRPVAA